MSNDAQRRAVIARIAKDHPNRDAPGRDGSDRANFVRECAQVIGNAKVLARLTGYKLSYIKPLVHSKHVSMGC